MPGTQRKAVINSETSGRFRTKTIGGREHIITEMVPIVGDTVMNSIHYPDAEVQASYLQLNNLPAPNGHPIVEGQKVSAFHPLAINAFNVGGFIKSPVKRGKKVTTEFWLDIEIAGNTDDGVELMRRIKEGEKVGVSTGLGLTLTTQNGTADDGKEFTAVGKDYQFDHVAILLNEIAAGDHAGTELVTNDGTELVVGFVENTTVHEMMESIAQVLKKQYADEDTHVWLRDFIIEESAAVYEKYDEKAGQARLFKVEIAQMDGEMTVSGIPTPVEEQISFIPATNSAPANKVKPEPEEEDMDITKETATEFLVNMGLAVTDPKADEAVALNARLEVFETNKEAFNAYMAKEVEALNTKRTECIEATGMTADEVEPLTVETMNKLIAKVTPITNQQLRGGGGYNASSGADDSKVGETYMRGAAAGE